MFNSIESMNEITNILAAFHETGKISADDQAKLKQLYSEVKSEDRQPQFIAQVETALEYAEEKADEEEEDKADDEADDDKKEEDKGQEHSEEEDDEDDEEDEDEEEDDEPKKATEEMVSISATELEQLRIVASEKIKSDVIKKVRSFSFSEKNKSGGIMPKAKNTAVEFALSLNEDQRKAFYAFLKKNQFDTSLFSELGTSKEDETKNMSEEEALNYKVQKYATENKLDYDVALRQYTEMEAQKEDTK